MSYVQFWKGPASGYNAETHGEGIYQCTDTGDTYVFGVLNKGASEGGSDLVIGETTGTAFDGGRGKAVEDNIKILPKTIVLGSDYSGNVFTVTPTQTAVNIHGISKVVGEEDSITHNESSFVIPSATPSKAGAMSATDKKKLDGLPSSLSSYATQSWVNSQGFAKVDDIPEIPINISAFTNDSGYQTSAQVNAAIQAVVGAAPDALDTLKEIADALNNDPDFADTIINQLSQKANKSEIPSLSGYATESWVTSRGYLTSIPANYVTETELSSQLSSYATQSWVNGRGFLTSIPSEYITSSELSSQLSSYATRSWVNSQNFATIDDIPEIPTNLVTQNGTVQNSTSNLNNCTTPGFYKVQNSPASIPSGAYGFGTLIVVNAGTDSENRVAQIYIPHFTEGSTSGYPLYVRTRNNTSWTNWITFGSFNQIQTLINTSLSGYATQSWVTGRGYLTSVPSNYVTDSELSSQLASYATQSWVTSRGYLTSVPSNYITSTQLSSQLASYATQSWVNSQGFLKSIPSNYATQEWVTGRGYITSSALSGYATQSWVNSQGFAKTSEINSYGENNNVTDYQVDLSKKVFYMTVDSSFTMTTTGSLENGQSCHIVIRHDEDGQITVTLPSSFSCPDLSNRQFQIGSQTWAEVNVLRAGDWYIARVVTKTN